VGEVLRENDGGGEPNQGTLQTYMEMSQEPPVQLTYANEIVSKNMYMKCTYGCCVF
jgi:hypothetical protein